MFRYISLRVYWRVTGRISDRGARRSASIGQYKQVAIDATRLDMQRICMRGCSSWSAGHAGHATSPIMSQPRRSHVISQEPTTDTIADLTTWRSARQDRLRHPSNSSHFVKDKRRTKPRWRRIALISCAIAVAKSERRISVAKINRKTRASLDLWDYIMDTM